ncbi:MAG: FlgD immunoglobulin-like domain containing protein, partial [candidate division WOR-3 bacterium]
GNSDKLVLACAEGSTPEVYVRERATIDDYDDWEETVNLSNTPNNGSDYPVVFLGDSVLVAWEERRNEEDYDVLACVNYGDTVNLADNSTKTSFPHVLLQPTSSPEPTVILHLIASENPKTEYYEVSYSKLDLAGILGGQQSASTTPARIQPELFPAQPNPFNRATTIRYQTGSAGRVFLRVFDASGRVVRTLDNSTRKPGQYTATWDGTDTRGRRVANGIYFYRLDTPDYRNVKKAVMMR